MAFAFTPRQRACGHAYSKLLVLLEEVSTSYRPAACWRHITTSSLTHIAFLGVQRASSYSNGIKEVGFGHLQDFPISYAQKDVNAKAVHLSDIPELIPEAFCGLSQLTTGSSVELPIMSSPVPADYGISREGV